MTNEEMIRVLQSYDVGDDSDLIGVIKYLEGSGVRLSLKKMIKVVRRYDVDRDDEGWLAEIIQFLEGKIQ